MRKILTFILILCTVTLFAEMRGGAQYDPGAVRSNLTNITSGSALGVANGGTGKTTAAEALAALGGASLNGSSTVAFNALTINGVTPLTDAEKTQALVGSSTVDFSCATLTFDVQVNPFTNPASNGYYKQRGQVMSLTAGAVATFTAFVVYAATIHVVNLSTAKCAVLCAGLGFTTILGQTAGTEYTVTKDNAGTVNIYQESNQIVIQNNTAATKTLAISLSGNTPTP